MNIPSSKWDGNKTLRKKWLMVWKSHKHAREWILMYAYKMAKHSPSENSSDFYAMAYKDWKGIDLVSYNIIKSKLLTIFYKISHVIK